MKWRPGVTLRWPTGVSLSRYEGVNLRGFSTLRRFFGKLENRRPHLLTLNNLSRYLGFDNFSAFAKHYNKYDEWYTWKQVNLLETKQKITNDDAIWLNSIKTKNEYPVMISYLLKSYLTNKRKENIEILLKDNCLEGLSYANQMKIGNSLGLYFRTLSLDEIKELVPFLKYEAFRNYALYLFVDYDSFFGYYGFFIQHAKKFLSDSDELLFNMLITYYAKWLSGKNRNQQITEQQFSKNIHPILQGRYFGCRIIASAESERKMIIKEMLMVAKNIDYKVSYFFEIVPVLIITKELNCIANIFDLYYSDLFDLKRWSQKDEESLYLIGLSFVEMKNNHFHNAINLLHRIDFTLLTDSYQSYSGLFYKIAEFHAQKNLKAERSVLLRIESEYNHLVKRTGFKRFSKDFLRNYFTAE